MKYLNIGGTEDHQTKQMCLAIMQTTNDSFPTNSPLHL